jgi:uncharacterized protein
VRTRRLTVRVKPGSRVSQLIDQGDGTWLARVKSQPVDGKANEELRALIANEFGLRKTQVSIRSGASGRAKVIEIEE